MHHTSHRLLLLFLSALALLSSCNGRQTTHDKASSSDTTAVTPQRRPITVAMVGDIMLGNTFLKQRLPPHDGKHLFDDAKPILRAADVAIGNLEGTMATEGKPRKTIGAKGSFMFMMPPSYVDLLVDAGFDFMGLGNNHINDFFAEGAISTENVLREAGLGYCGAYHGERTEDHNDEYSLRTIDGVRYGFVAVGYEKYNQPAYDSTYVARVLKEVRPQCDVLVVNFHGGAEGTGVRHLPDEGEHFMGDYRGYLRRLGHGCIDLGADIVMGSGPHVVRAIELYKGHLIIYSLGNFCTPGMGTAGLVGYAPIITATIDAEGKLIEGQIHSMLQSGMTGPRHDAKRIVQHEITQLTHDDIAQPGLTITEEGKIVVKK